MNWSVLDLIVASAMVQGAFFSPPLDRDFAYVTEQVRTDESGERRYRVERTLRFARDGDGLFADLTLNRIIGDKGGEGAMFERALAGLKGRTVRYRLSPYGTLVSIDAIDGHWSALVEGMAGDARGTRGVPIVEAFRGAPPTRRTAMFWSMLDPLIIAAIAADGPYTHRPVSQAGQSAGGAPELMSGTERLERADGGGLRLTRIVQSRPAAPGGPSATTTAPAIERERETTALLDPQTGLLAQSTDRMRLRIGGRDQVSTTRITLTES